ncbi:BTAD domain-containing putative transcriptional regulator [Streptomyces silvisoli]|uniref:BTAD domain-containing putative transcriptional regulator n=1 Tax=Streptomyces silvisoli TaxID=3034235 RepID=A0ABT5ZEJ1_9ACTN|nr:BTAD domain-containing putative transcriptional regulator [Streptomyces silvisoli]MDF3288101.1 BTAD domain-containing putative transcriptional regulator [Streptomyces silvisoli]
MPSTATADQPTATVLTDQEREVLYAIGCGMREGEIAAALAVPEHAVAERLGRILAKLGLRDRAAAIVHAFDCGLVIPGQGPRGHTVTAAPRITVRRAAPVPDPWLRISVLGPLLAWQAGRPVDLGPVRQQAVLAVLALCPDRAVSQQELLDGVWGMAPPIGNVVPVYIYRLRKILRLGDSPESVITRDRCGYRFARNAVEVDVARMEELVSAAGAAERAGDLAEAVRACSRALDLFRGEPLAGLPGPFAELERLRLAERRIALAQRKLDWQLRLGQHREAIAELSALTVAHPQNEPIAAMLMCALHRSGRRTEALAVFDRTRRHLADDLGVAPGELLRRTRQVVLRENHVERDRTRTRAAR